MYICLRVVYTYLEQMTSWEVWAAGSSFSRLLERSIDCRWRRPQGTTEGRAVRQLDDRSRCVIRDDRSMNQSSSNQGSCRPLQNTLTACTHVDIRSNQPTIQSYFCVWHRDERYRLVFGVIQLNFCQRAWSSVGDTGSLLSPVLPRWMRFPRLFVWEGFCRRLGGPSECRRKILLPSAAGSSLFLHYLENKNTTLNRKQQIDIFIYMYLYVYICKCVNIYIKIKTEKNNFFFLWYF